MKTLLLLLLAIPALSHARDAALEELIGRAETAQNSYQSMMRFRDMQMESLQTELGNLYNLTGGKPVDYNTYRGTFKFEVDHLRQRISSISQSVPGRSFDVKGGALDIDSQLLARRSHYFKALNELATNPASETLKLKPQLAEDLKFARATRDLSPTEFNRALKAYEGRNFGKYLTERAQIEGMEPNGQVKVRTYHSQTELTLKRGQQLRITTPTGDLVSGKVMGVMPNGDVLVQGEPPFGLESDFPDMARGRVINLNDAADVKIYSPGSERPAELSVRYQSADIKEAIRQNRLTRLNEKPKANGEIADVDPIRASVIDKRAGEVLRPNSFGPAGTFR